VSVDANARDLRDAFENSLPQPLLVTGPLHELLRRQAGSLPETDEAGDVLGAAPPPPLLASAVDDGVEVQACPHAEGPDALRSVELVARYRERRDRDLPNVESRPARGLHSVGVQGDAPLGADLRELAYGLHGADLVVRPDHRGESGIRAQGALELCRVDEPVRIYPDPRDLEALRFQAPRGLADGGVLDARDHHVPLLG
jgi:hypothetical protein